MNKGKIKKRVVLIISAVILLAVILILCFSCKKKDTDKPEREVHTLTTDNISTGDTVTDDTGEKTSTNEADSSSSENSGTSRLTVEVGSATATTEISTKTMDAESSTDKSTRSTTESTTRSSTEKTTRTSTEYTTRVTTRSTTETTTEKPTEETTKATTESTTKVQITEAPQHNHNWVWKTHTETVHHDAVTHEEPIYDYDWSVPMSYVELPGQEGVWGQPVEVTKIHCGVCGKFYDSMDDFIYYDACGGSYGPQKVTVDVIPAEKIIVGYDTVVDKEAYDEVIEVKDYEYCSYCGKKK